MPGAGESATFSPDGTTLVLGHFDGDHITLVDSSDPDASNWTIASNSLALDGAAWGSTFTADGSTLVLNHADGDRFTLVDTAQVELTVPRLGLGTAAPVANLDVHGNVTIRGDFEDAFAVLNGSDVPLFQVDTQNNRVYIGTPGGDTTGALLVLGTKTTAGDPAGVDGAMYYNQDMGKFRCFESGEWKDCISSDIGVEKVVFTSDGTFNKADYPGMRAVRVQVQGGGGAGGGAATTGSGESSAGSGGGGGGYAESVIQESDLPSGDITVIVGSGGSGATNASGSNGGQSRFDTIVRAGGGFGGGRMLTGSNPQVFGPGEGGSTFLVGDITRVGGSGGYAFRISTISIVAGFGGGSYMGESRATHCISCSPASGNNYGGGGPGAHNGGSQGTARAGGNGAPGIVIVHVYY